MKIYSLTCSRDEKLSETTSKLLEYFERCDITSKILVGESSIFEAYAKGIDSLEADREDIVILCHDDIEILSDPTVFTQVLQEKLSKEDTGFVGVAGTRRFAQTAIWWDKEEWMAGSHSGIVYHGNDIFEMQPTLFGNTGQVVVMDGVFLAAKVKTLRTIQMKKPTTFVGKWDFYDIFYTFQAHRKGLKNYTLPIQIRHESLGELAGRDSWHKNRESFISYFGKELPASIL
jgi:hypothetical protein